MGILKHFDFGIIKHIFPWLNIFQSVNDIKLEKHILPVLLSGLCVFNFAH